MLTKENISKPNENITGAIDPYLKRMCSVVKRVIVENFSYCNRSCEFCSNVVINRQTTNDILAQKHFEKILEELSNGNFTNSIAFGRYSEPLANRLTFRRVELTRKYLKNAHIYINTNGDYLNISVLEKLRSAGLNELKIMVYLPNGKEFTTDAAKTHCDRFIKKMGFEVSLNKNVEDQTMEFIVTNEKRMRIIIRAEDYFKVGSNRGGIVTSLSKRKRTEPCFASYYEINIDYDGNYVPCCNIRSDAEQHRKYIIGNIQSSTLTELYYSEKLFDFRNQTKNNIEQVIPCKSCQYYWPQ